MHETATPGHLPIPAAASLAGLSVRLRLRLLLAGLLAMFFISALLFVLGQRQDAASAEMTSRVAHTLHTLQTTQEVQRGLVELRRGLVVAVSSEVLPSAAAATDLVLGSSTSELFKRVSALDSIDSATARSARASAEALIAAARKGSAALDAGRADEGRTLYCSFPQLGAPADAALQALAERQQRGLTGLMEQTSVEQERAHWLRVVLHLLLVAIGLAASLTVLRTVFRPLQSLYLGLDRLARGKVLPEPPVKSGDEFGQMGMALFELSKITSELQQIAYTDSLTGLPNRAQFELDFAGFGEASRPVALLTADLDHFRTINDGYGHAFGDAVLKAVAERLQWLLSGGMKLYRHGGDRFLLLLPARSDDAAFRTEAAAQAERVRARLSEPFTVAGRVLPLCVSLGVAVAPDDGSTAETLIGAADSAVFQAKRQGRNNVQHARGDYAVTARRRLDLADDLRGALAAGQVIPHFQPIIDLSTGQIVCAEALARWQHPVRGFVPPDEFIAVAEASGQIDMLTRQLLKAACRAAVDCCNIAGRSPRMAINLSARQVRQGVVEMISEALAESGLPASRLEVEITESAIIERTEIAERLLLELRTLGVSVALDDFGTGYSSLSYLLRFPIDKIKIDKSFVARVLGQEEAAKIIGATVALANSLGITLVAEGVENTDQMAALYGLGCRQQQGWLFSKALPAQEFMRWKLDAPLHFDAVIHAGSVAANEMRAAA